MQEWLACAKAILAKVPDAKFGGPDVGSSSNWITQFIPAAAKELGDHLVAVSGHYYAEGPPDDPKVTTARLLRSSPQIGRSTKSISDLARGASEGVGQADSSLSTMLSLAADTTRKVDAVAASNRSLREIIAQMQDAIERFLGVGKYADSGTEPIPPAVREMSIASRPVEMEEPALIEEPAPQEGPESVQEVTIEEIEELEPADE